MKDRIRIAIFLLAASVVVVTAQTDKVNVIADAERAFEKAVNAVTLPAPGCAVGLSLKAESVFEKAFGLAEIEHKVPNTQQTISSQAR